MATQEVSFHSMGPFPYDDSLWSALKTTGQIFVGTAPTIPQNVIRLADLDTRIKTYSVEFTAVTSITILGSTHTIAKTDISVTLWDSSNPRLLIEAGSITIDQTTFDIVITFIDAQSGRVVLIG